MVCWCSVCCIVLISLLLFIGLCRKLSVLCLNVCWYVLMLLWFVIMIIGRLCCVCSLLSVLRLFMFGIWMLSSM